MTANKYWIFLEQLRRSGIVNMFGAAPFIERKFGVSQEESYKILGEWMKNYDSADYEGMGEE